MKTTLAIINAAPQGRTCLALSGGSDSIVLMDILFMHTDRKPLVVFADSLMEYPDTEAFCKAACSRYGAELHVARPAHTPEEQWHRYGWPMLGKLAARTWMQRHRGDPLGFKIDVSTCCRKMKIGPARKLAKALGCSLQFTGVRGGGDDILRGLRAIKDTATHYVKADKMTICNPLTGWTDTMIRRYTEEHDLPIHPAKKERGAMTIGCVCCGGGSQFTISAFRILRRSWPEAWRRYVVDAGMGRIVLAIKYDTPLATVDKAIAELGGIERLTRERPWVFDFTTDTPAPGYAK